MRAVRADPIVALDDGQEFLDEKILVPDAAVARIDVKGAAGSGRGNQELADAFLVPEILDQVPAAGIEEDLLIFAEAVKEIEHRVAAGFIRIVARWKKNAIRNAAFEDFAGDGTAFGAACGVGRAGEKEAAEQQKQKRRRDAGATRAGSMVGRSKRDSSTARPGASRKTKARDTSLGMTAAG